ncbi:hypothetical protein M409DRAFT_50323 [Zasmidium cellare ATCC 36951]|uniref:Uncharacterized protein n=1 Tax=Zasmidium cellare ATCC 36951 TaxID=1080233 RepID=A0A6A6D0G8_ZASCE|nr:uncharacterized protein M409DRAFT_50323 [Zasmidium cellare ATCC 36951]KAF2171652.1 hypothetical protein M409DRAFT_50323 [Zasmidium cellare ATCC 36951]
MKAPTTLALAALLGSKAALAAPTLHADDYEKKVMLANAYMIEQREGLCLEWRVEPNDRTWLQDTVKGGKKYWPTMQARCNSFQMEQGPRDGEYIVYPASGTPESCGNWQVKVQNNYVSPICMDDASRMDMEDPAPDLNDELPVNVDWHEPLSNNGSDPEQPSMQILATAWQAGEPYKECAAWKVVHRGFDGVAFAAGIAPECWKWKDSAEKLNNYTIIAGKFGATCTSSKGYITRLDGHVAYAQCASTPDVGFDNSTTVYPDPHGPEDGGEIEDEDKFAKKLRRRQQQPSGPDVTFVDQEWVSRHEYFQSSESYCTEWVISHAAGHNDILIPSCHHWIEGEINSYYSPANASPTGPSKSTARTSGLTVPPAKATPRRPDPPSLLPPTDPKKSSEPSITYVQDDDVHFPGNPACKAWTIDSLNGTRKVLVPRCIEQEVVLDAPEYYTVATALVEGDCHTQWVAKTAGNRVYPVCASGNQKADDVSEMPEEKHAANDDGLCGRADKLTPEEFGALTQEQKATVLWCKEGPRLLVEAVFNMTHHHE